MPNGFRYDNFLKGYKFYANSIEFRISSSKSLEKWKNVQSFQLNQLINGKFFFQQDRREILLLKYDITSRLLYEIENYCIEASGQNVQGTASRGDVDFISTLVEKSSARFRSIITDEHKDNFNTEFVHTWLNLHEPVETYKSDRIRSFLGQRYDMIFRSIVDLLTETMQYTLVEIHELDALFCKSKFEYIEDNTKVTLDCNNSCFKTAIPFIIVSDFSNRISAAMQMCLIIQRLEIYLEHFKIETIYIKNYTDDVIDEDLISKIENMGIEIDFRKSICRP